MKPKTSIWQRIGLHEWFLKKEPDAPAIPVPTITPNDVYHYIGKQFDQSVAQLSFANRIVFFHEYIICFNADDYHDFMESKKGIFGLIAQEAVRHFYERLAAFRAEGKTVEPSASKWVFRFVSHPDYARGDKGFMGRLLPGSTAQKEENLRVTYIPRQTGIAETFDVNPEILRGFNFYSEGYYELPYQSSLRFDGRSINAPSGAALARLETILPDKAFAGKKVEFLMQHEEITVAGSEAKEDHLSLFKIPSDWVDTPHLRIRFNRAEGKFYVASFGEKTMLNEVELRKSTVAAPLWTELPVNSRMMLNGIVGINIFKP